MEEIIRVEAVDDIAVCMSEAGAERARLTLVCDMERLHLREAGNDFPGTIGRSIVDDDDFERGILLRQRGADAGGKKERVVVIGNDYGDKRRLVRNHGLLRHPDCPSPFGVPLHICACARISDRPG